MTDIRETLTQVREAALEERRAEMATKPGLDDQRARNDGLCPWASLHDFERDMIVEAFRELGDVDYTRERLDKLAEEFLS